MAVDYDEWLEGEYPRVLLAELTAVSSSTTVTRLLGSENYQTDDDSIYDGVIAGPIDIERTMGAVFGAGGAIYNGGELSVINVGDMDSWVYDNWRGQPIALYYGNPSWSIDDIKSEGKIFSGRIDSVAVVSDTSLRILFQGLQQKLQEPIQALTIYRHSKVGELAHMAYGYPKNVTGWVVGTHEGGSPDYEIKIHEKPSVEDPAVARYANQVVSTSPGISKSTTNDTRHLDFTTDPEAMMTFDVKGAKTSGGTWLTTLGEIIEDMMTREVGFETGVVQDSTATDKVQLEETASSEDDFYNGDTLSLNGKTGGDYEEESETISDYDGATRVATVSVAYSEFTPARGFGYKITGQTVQLGPLTASEIDSTAMTQFDSDLPYECGIYIDDDRTAEQALQDMLAPGAGYWWTRAGKLAASILKDPENETSSLSLTTNDLIGDIQIEQGRPPIWFLSLGYDRNHTVQSGSVAGQNIDQDRQNWINKEYRVAKRSNASILDNDPEARNVTVDTVFTTESEAYTELDRIWDLFSVQRYLYTFVTTTKAMQVDIGDVITLTDDRFDLSGGKNMVVVGMRESPLDERVEVTGWL